MAPGNRERLRAMLAGVACALLAACTAVEQSRYPPEHPATSVFVVSHGWHSGIVLRAADVERGVWPEAADFPAAEFLEVGWGDRDYYPAQHFNAWYAIKALLWPTEAVLHVVPLQRAPAAAFPESDLVELPLSRDGIARLNRRIAASFARDGKARSEPLGAGLYGGGRFYLSRERFHLFKTCNVWTARVLREAGIPVPPCITLLPGCVINFEVQGPRPVP